MFGLADFIVATLSDKTRGVCMQITEYGKAGSLLYEKARKLVRKSDSSDDKGKLLGLLKLSHALNKYKQLIDI